jgi:NAD(P)-dependent dehydrogenase (short-subunit alcohol dehydrogenase family)
MGDQMTDRERVVLITGATSGLGRELSGVLSAEPGRLILHGRDQDRLADLRQELSDSQAAIDTVVADLAEQAQVRQLAEDVAGLTDHLSVLVNNAGIGKGRSESRELSPDGHELRLAVNHLAPFALTLRLLPLLEAGAPSRVVNVASAAQQPIDFDDLHLAREYSGSRAYAQSKLAMIATGFHLAERLPPKLVTVNSLHPATLMPTAMVREGYGYSVDDLETGVAAVKRLIDSPDLEGVSGRYFSRTEQSRAIAAAYKPEVQLRLWEISQELTDTRL